MTDVGVRLRWCRPAPLRMPRSLAFAGAIILAGGVFSSPSRAAGDGHAGWCPSSLEDLLQRYPTAEANETALEVETLAAALGVSLAPKWTAGRPQPSMEASKEFNEAASLAEKWLKQEMERADVGPTAPPPSGLREFLSHGATVIDALRQKLTRARPPCVEEGPGWGFFAGLTTCGS